MVTVNKIQNGVFSMNHNNTRLLQTKFPLYGNFANEKKRSISIRGFQQKIKLKNWKVCLLFILFVTISFVNVYFYSKHVRLDDRANLDHILENKVYLKHIELPLPLVPIQESLQLPLPAPNNKSEKIKKMKMESEIKSQSLKRQTINEQDKKNKNNRIVQKEDHVDQLKKYKIENTSKQTKPVNNRHEHVIPNFIIFTHYKRLLSPSIFLVSNASDIVTQISDNIPTNLNPIKKKDINSQIKPSFTDEEIALANNIQNTISFHPTSTIRYLTDDDCIRSIQNAMKDENTKIKLKQKQNKKVTEQDNEKLVKYFQNETKGMYKADICRGAALYETGGLYFDVDIQARMTIWSVLSPTTDFVTVKVHRESNHPGGFFQAFIGVTKHHPVIKLYLKYFLEYYEGKRKVDGPLGVILLGQAYNDYRNSLQSHGSDEKSSFHERMEEELWQEIKYHPRLFPDVDPPTGKRRACHFMVAIPWKKGVAPFYSRVKGSRMCGGKDSKK